MGLPRIPDHCSPTHHIFHLILRSPESRRGPIAHLGERGIMAMFHYVPLHLSKMGRAFGGRPVDHPLTEHVSERILRLPFYFDLTAQAQREVVDAIPDCPDL